MRRGQVFIEEPPYGPAACFVVEDVTETEVQVRGINPETAQRESWVRYHRRESLMGMVFYDDCTSALDRWRFWNEFTERRRRIIERAMVSR